MMYSKIRLMILSLWLGVMAFFSFVVAPSAFVALPETNLAGHVVSVVLGRTEIIGIVLSVAALLTLFIRREQSGKMFLIELITLGLMGFSMIFSHFVVSRQLHEMRIQLGNGVNSIPATGPERVAFDQLHQLSVGLMSFAMIATLLLIVLLLRRSAGQPQAI